MGEYGRCLSESHGYVYIPPMGIHIDWCLIIQLNPPSGSRGRKWKVNGSDLLSSGRADNFQLMSITINASNARELLVSMKLSTIFVYQWLSNNAGQCFDPTSPWFQEMNENKLYTLIHLEAVLPNFVLYLKSYLVLWGKSNVLTGLFCIKFYIPLFQ